jgi:hypothetical protein
MEPARGSSRAPFSLPETDAAETSGAGWKNQEPGRGFVLAGNVLRQKLLR